MFKNGMEFSRSKAIQDALKAVRSIANDDPDFETDIRLRMAETKQKKIERRDLALENVELIALSYNHDIDVRKLKSALKTIAEIAHNARV